MLIAFIHNSIYYNCKKYNEALNRHLPEGRNINHSQSIINNSHEKGSQYNTDNRPRTTSNTYPDLRGIISPTTVGIAATGKALEDAGKSGKIELTGLGLPSEMKQYIKNGTCRQMSLWNPIDLGYSSTYIAYKLLQGEFQGKEGEVMKVGRMGEIKIGPDNVAVMSEPFIFEKDNIDKFAEIY
ncbi:unnamed protein product [marine sediment metagenome]|uniref:Periplasmic binding protein domain-containing protein n=2 Tax=marine sediment metagenome TaxID=412755 RepID=X1RKE0_9ZZZZ